MIDQILLFLKKSLNDYLASGKNTNDLQEDQVSFFEWKNSESINLPTGKISILLINLEQEKVLRNEDPFIRNRANGSVEKRQPEIRINLYLLFVARYPQYEDSLRYLSGVIQYFQGHHLLNHQNSPTLDDNIEQIIMELVSLSFSEQNEIWGMLRLPYHPSVMYKVRMAVFQDEDADMQVPVVKERIIGIKG